MRKTLLLWLALFPAIATFACTSVIISGRVTYDGRPLMLKHRDTGTLDNRINYVSATDTSFAYIGLVNVPDVDGVWTGTNEVGFAIMNTASYNLRRDTLNCRMDREGEVMKLALETCRTITDFEALLNQLLVADADGRVEPLGVETNFGVIDAVGGAAYYEVNNFEWVKFDVNKEKQGYRVVTNFSFSGRENEGSGYERYQTASAVMRENEQLLSQGVDHRFLFDSLSRSYRHEIMGVNYDATNAPRMAPDVNFIPRGLTSASIVIEGVCPGENPLHTVMWTILGYPACSVALPLMVGGQNILPAYVQSHVMGDDNSHSLISDNAMLIRNQYVFPVRNMGSNSSQYFSTEVLFRGVDGLPALLNCAKQADEEVYQSFYPAFCKWRAGKMADARFWKMYKQQSSKWFAQYQSAFSGYIVP